MNPDVSNYFDALVLHETRLWALVERRVRATSASVSLARFTILRAVDQSKSDCRVQDLAEGLRITVGAASRIVDRMVGDDLLSRAPHPTDRRSSRLTLTSQGRRALSTTAAALDAALTDLLGPVDSELIATLATGIQRVDAQLAGAREKP